MKCLLMISDFEAIAIDASVNQFFRSFLRGDTFKRHTFYHAFDNLIFKYSFLSDVDLN